MLFINLRSKEKEQIYPWIFNNYNNNNTNNNDNNKNNDNNNNNNNKYLIN